MRLLIEERHAGHPAREEALLATRAEHSGVSVIRTTWKPFVKRNICPLPGDVVAGSVAFVRSALQSLGKTLPLPNPYPDSLQPWLYRKVWKGGMLGEVLASNTRVFIKPAKRWKLFTGFVVDSPNPPELHGISRREPVWCAEPVSFLSEWRAYVVDRQVCFVGLADHGGDRAWAPDPAEIQRAVNAYEGQPSAYAIDFGVLASGETALVEVNDGFSVGAYDGVPSDVYYTMIATRWLELAGTSNSSLAG